MEFLQVIFLILCAKSNIFVRQKAGDRLCGQQKDKMGYCNSVWFLSEFLVKLTTEESNINY